MFATFSWQRNVCFCALFPGLKKRKGGKKDCHSSIVLTFLLHFKFSPVYSVRSCLHDDLFGVFSEYTRSNQQRDKDRMKPIIALFWSVASITLFLSGNFFPLSRLPCVFTVSSITAGQSQLCSVINHFVPRSHCVRTCMHVSVCVLVRLCDLYLQ